MTRGNSTSSSNTYCGQSLSIDALKHVETLRARIGADMPKAYDTDYNLYRWIINAEKTHKSKSARDEMLDAAEKALRNHLLFRRLLHFDDRHVPEWHENPLFADKLLPLGAIAPRADRHNRLVWYIEYRSLKFEVSL